jgi:uncharacterized UBP type Zn finger protein
MSDKPAGAQAKNCTHVSMIEEVIPSGQGCLECLRMGDTWFHLRVCMTCGQVGCCDQSKNRHARKHYEQTGHAVVRSFQPGEKWMWCFADEVYLK